MPEYSVDLVKLKSIREQRGLTQYQMADRLGISKQNYNFIENGKRNISLVMAKQIAEFFNTEIEDIFFTHQSTKCGLTDNWNES